MIFQYYSETDMLYIKLSIGVSMESEEVAPGILINFGASLIKDGIFRVANGL